MAKSGRSSGLLLVVLALLVAGAAGGYFYWKGKQPKPFELTTTTVTRGDVRQAITATGDIESVTTIDVSSTISGQIIDLFVDFNTPVKTGQLLARIDPATYQSRLRQAEADLMSTEANNTLVRLNTERIRELRAKNLVSQQELDQGEAQLKQSNAQLQTRQAAVEDAKVNLSRCEIKSPIDGIVLSRNTEKGKTVSASTSAPTLFVIVNDLTKMQINAAVAEADIGSIELGQPVNFTVDAFPGRQFRGTITQIRNLAKANQNVVTYETLIEVRNDDLKLKPGMTANVSIIAAEKRNTLRVSNSALRTRIPEELLPKAPPPAPAAPAKTDAKAASAEGAGDKSAATTAAPAKPMTEEEKRRAMRDLLREASGGVQGRPTPEIIAKAQQLAKERNLDVDFSQMGRGRGGDRGERASGTAAAPVERTVYKLMSNDPKDPKLEPVTIKLGITDGITTEVIEGVNEGDVLVTAAIRPGSAVAQGAPSNNPFTGGGQRGFGGAGGGGGGGRRGGF